MKLGTTQWTEGFFLPGFCDLHIHAPQWNQRGLGMDLPLLDWLQRYTFPEETKFADTAYAKEVYHRFAQSLLRSGALYASVFGTIHADTVEILAEELDAAGLRAFVGKVNMDRNGTADLRESTKQSLQSTESFLRTWRDHERVRPIITPRFIPSCTKELLAGLGRLANEYQVPVQSHPAETRREVSWVKELHPDALGYAHVYHEYGLFGRTPTWMAHCIYLSPEEQDLMLRQRVTAVHCPESNFNLGSGLMPTRQWVDAGITVALGTDVGAGHDAFVPRAIVRALQASNLRSTVSGEDERISFREAFSMATSGGQAYFGIDGGWAPNQPFEALWIDDQGLGPQGIPLVDRLQRFVYTGTPDQIRAVFLNRKTVEW